MRILGIIPARGGSKGIPGKNIKLLGNKPLIEYTFATARESRGLSKIIVSTEDKEILNVCAKIGLEAPFIRPAHLAKDKTPSIDVILHALDFFIKKGEEFDAVCLLQPTTPFRAEGLIEEAIAKFVSSDFDSLISVREIPTDFNPHWTFEKVDGALKITTGEDVLIPRRQDLPKAYHRDGAIYITKTAVLIKQESLLGKQIGYVVAKGAQHINIDTPEDWDLAEKILNKKT